MQNLMISSDVESVFQAFIRSNVEDGEVKKKTLKEYIYHINQFFEYCRINGLHPLSVKHADMIRYKNFLMKDYQISTVKQKIGRVKHFYKYCIINELLTGNPVNGIKIKGESNPEDKIKYLTKAEFKKLFSSIKLNTDKKYRDYCILWLMGNLGLRVIEVRRINIGHISNDHMEITGKNDKWRRIPITAKTKKIIRQWLEKRKEYINPIQQSFNEIMPDKPFSEYGDKEPLFISMAQNNKGKRLSTRAIRYCVDHYFEYAGLKSEGKSCHTLRHTFGTLYLSEGGNINVIQSMLGHSSSDMTRLYAKISEKMLSENNPTKVMEEILA